MSFNFPGYQLLSPIAKMPGTLVSNAAVSTGISSPSFNSMPQSAPGPAVIVRPKNGSSTSQAISKLEPSLVLTIAVAIWPPSPLSAATWPSTKSIDQAHHPVDAVGGGAELIAPVQQREVARERRQVERPVERGI